ncbi:hypothetical protein M422DRAFT_186363, partial [Sphaerobolus stellatus SS14]
PSIAFNINLLDLVSINMYYLAPNISGWSLTLECFWKEQGYTLGQQNFIKRCFSNAYQWYNILCDAAAGHVDALINTAVVPVTSDQLQDQPQDHPPPVPVVPTEQPQCPLATPAVSPELAEADAHTPCGEPPKHQQVGVGESMPSPSAAMPAEAPHEGPPPTLKLTRPSEHLCKCCPLCFGGVKPDLRTSRYVLAHVLVAIDANLAQKCLKPRFIDITFAHSQTQFIPDKDVKAMEAHVEEMRKTKAKRSLKINLRLPEDILQECQDSFTAANEEQTKSSVVVFADTGLVAMVCRHDHILWVINMTRPGEKQHYTFALLDRLFAHLPDDWTVGLLYDIACQIERSMAKHGILAKFFACLVFAVSVFHAYGHQWPCQLLYHPHKVEGYGLTDGKGCERIWSWLNKLIPSLLHLCRQWVIDRQILHIMKDNLRTLACYIHRKRKACTKCDSKARKILQDHKVPERELREQWQAQVLSQTASLKCIVEQQEWQSRVVKLDKLVREALYHDDDTYVQFVEELESACQTLDALKECLKQKERSLGVLNPRKLANLKGSEYLQPCMNARVVKTRIRKKLVEQKFERARLEKAYEQQVAVSTLVSHFNRLVQELEGLKARGGIPRGVELPMWLEAQELSRMDVDDPIWVDVMGDEEANNGPPRWMSDEAVRACIPALLERDRVKEELEQLQAEEVTLKSWLREEIDRTLVARAGAGGMFHISLDELL